MLPGSERRTGSTPLRWTALALGVLVLMAVTAPTRTRPTGGGRRCPRDSPCRSHGEAAAGRKGPRRGRAGQRPLSAPLASAELYDPATGEWTAVGDMNVARSGHTATLLTEPGCAPHCGKVLVVGGAVTQDPTAAGLEVTDSAELYDPATKTWSATSSVPGARAFHTASRDFVRGGHAAAWCGKVLVAGGEQAGTTTEVPRPPTSVIHRAEHTATLMPDGRVLVVGGLNEFDQPRFSAEIYDPATPEDPWPTNPLTPAMTNGRASHPLPRPQRAGRRRRRPRPGLESHGALHALALAWKPDARR